jgi:hypothetical protein
MNKFEFLLWQESILSWNGELIPITGKWVNEVALNEIEDYETQKL